MGKYVLCRQNLVATTFTLIFVLCVYIYGWNPPSSKREASTPQWNGIGHSSHEHGTNSTIPKHGFIIPNIIHYFWISNPFKKQQFNFVNYLSVKSAVEHHGPERIVFHCDILPTDFWLRKAWEDFPMVAEHIVPLKNVFNRTAKHVEHLTDVMRIEVLMKEGGIYLDADVIVLKSLDEFRVFPAVMSVNLNIKKLANSIIMAEPGSAFLQLWYETYKTEFRPREFVYNSGFVPYRLAQARADLIYVVPPGVFAEPQGANLPRQMKVSLDWSGLSALHITTFDAYFKRPEDFHKGNNTVCEILRFVYYGSKEIR